MRVSGDECGCNMLLFEYKLAVIQLDNNKFHEYFRVKP